MIGYLGGTFDPVHLGHIYVAEQVAAALGLSRINLILSARPGHKSEISASANHRWEMLRIACETANETLADESLADEESAQKKPWVLVPDNRELLRGGTSWTVDTLADIRRADPGSRPCWITGVDSWETIDEWRGWEQLPSLCNFVVVSRGGAQARLSPRAKQIFAPRLVDTLDHRRVGQVLYLDNVEARESSTQIRRRLSDCDQSWDQMVAPSVAAYIRDNSLYRQLK